MSFVSCFKKSFVCIFILALFSNAIAFADCLKIQVFKGKEVGPYLPEISEVCVTVYREYPYMFGHDAQAYEEWLQTYVNSDNSIVCLAFDHAKIVGVITGVPLAEFDHENYVAPFLEKGINISPIFYMGEFAVLPEYSDSGLEEKLYKKFVRHVKREKMFNTICVADMEDSATEHFIREHGFIQHPDMWFYTYWNDVGDDFESPHVYTYWTKEI